MKLLIFNIDILREVKGKLKISSTVGKLFTSLRTLPQIITLLKELPDTSGHITSETTLLRRIWENFHS